MMDTQLKIQLFHDLVTVCRALAGLFGALFIIQCVHWYRAEHSRRTR